MLLTDVLVTMFNAVPSGEQGTEVQQAIVATSRALQKAMTHAEAEEQMDTLIGAMAVKYTSPAETDQPELLSRYFTVCAGSLLRTRFQCFPCRRSAGAECGLSLKVLQAANWSQPTELPEQSAY